MTERLNKAEWAVAILLTLLILSFHYINATSAGGLWRDEANTVGLATLPHMQQVWSLLQFDSFPILWILIVRAVAATGGYLNDPVFRALGFCVGVAIIGAIWYYARTTTSSAPLLSLVLVAMAPAVIRYGDSMRAYGLGIFLNLLTATLMWRFLRQPTKIHFVAAALSAVLSVQALYYNAVVLAALCAAGVAVCLLDRDWKKAALIALIGALAAISIIPYLAAVRDAADWSITFRVPEFTLDRFRTKLEAALGLGGTVAVIAWFAAFGAALICGTAAFLRPERFKISRADREVILFNLVALVSAVVGVYVFLKILSYPTEHWYYLSMLALAGICIDSLFGAIVRQPAARTIRLAVVLMLAAATFLPARRTARSLETTVDIIASRLKTVARKGDLIVVSNWYEGITFDRYYRGEAGWITVPTLNVHRIHRYDLVMDQMRIADQAAPVRPVVDGVERALRTGHRVYVVGSLESADSTRGLTVLPPAPLPGNAWPVGRYERQWSSIVGYYLKGHAAQFSELSIAPPTVYSIHENVRLFVATGWRP